MAATSLNFKTETLTDYIESQWRLLQDNGFGDDEGYKEVARKAVETFASNLLRSETELIFILDDQGDVVLSTSLMERTLEGWDALMQADTTPGNWQSFTIMGVERLVNASFFPSYQWKIFVTEARETFYGAVRSIFWQTGIILVLSLLGAVLLLVLVTGYVSRPLEGMTGIIENIISTGDLNFQVPTTFKDETGRLAHSFNLMTGELEKSYGRIKAHALRAVVAQKREQKIRNIFQKYVPMDIIDKFFENPESMLRGENRVLTVLFSDIRGFTTINETMLPHEMVESLNRYLGIMVEAITQHRGIIDKYIGDAIMAFFGAPVQKEGDAEHSIQAALEMLDSLEDFNKWQEKKERHPFHIGIGLNYGLVTIGNIGSEKKMDYTVIGDMVNLASRLEGATKFYGVPLVISEFLWEQVKDSCHTRPLDRIVVKGKAKPVEVYTAASALTDRERELWDVHGRGLKEYYHREFSKAHELFTQALRIAPEDVPSQIFLQRSQKYKETPLPEDWDGVEHLTSK